MSVGLSEIVNIDDHGDVEVNFDYEDGLYYVNYVVDKDGKELYNWKNIPGWVKADIFLALEAKREK